MTATTIERHRHAAARPRRFSFGAIFHRTRPEPPAGDFRDGMNVAEALAKVPAGPFQGASLAGQPAPSRFPAAPEVAHEARVRSAVHDTQPFRSDSGLMTASGPWAVLARSYVPPAPARPPSARTLSFTSAEHEYGVFYRTMVHRGRYLDISALFDAAEERARAGFARASRVFHSAAGGAA